MPVSWPGSLPEGPTSFTLESASVVIRTQPDTGPVKVRRRFTKALKKAKMGFLLTIAQWETLEDFFNDDLAGGSISMLFKHPWTQATIEMMVAEPPAYQNEDTLGVRAQLSVEYF